MKNDYGRKKCTAQVPMPLEMFEAVEKMAADRGVNRPEMFRVIIADYIQRNEAKT